MNGNVPSEASASICDVCFDIHVLRSRFRFDVGDLPTLVLGCPVKPISPYPKSSTKNMITLGRFVFSERDDEMKEREVE